MLFFLGFLKRKYRNMDLVIDNIWLILFFAWGMPLGIYRSKFRKIVYETDSWTINIKPLFLKELKGLFGNLYPGNPEYLKMRNFYRFYLLIYNGLFISYQLIG
jgi:peroxiredoxin Q/BCP